MCTKKIAMLTTFFLKLLEYHAIQLPPRAIYHHLMTAGNENLLTTILLTTSSFSLSPSFFPITHLFMQSISLFISFAIPPSLQMLFSVCLSFSIFSVPLLPVLGAVPQQGGGGKRERERENVDGRRKKGSEQREGLVPAVLSFCKSIQPFACPFPPSTTSLSHSISPYTKIRLRAVAKS